MYISGFQITISRYIPRFTKTILSQTTHPHSCVTAENSVSLCMHTTHLCIFYWDIWYKTGICVAITLIHSICFKHKKSICL